VNLPWEEDGSTSLHLFTLLREPVIAVEPSRGCWSMALIRINLRRTAKRRFNWLYGMGELQSQKSSRRALEGLA
jgi:hypothetical protein